jgi:hypothetical protein
MSDPITIRLTFGAVEMNRWWTVPLAGIMCATAILLAIDDGQPLFYQ